MADTIERLRHRYEATSCRAPWAAFCRFRVVVTVLRLFLTSGPAHVAGFVVSVVVDALQCVSGRRTWPEVAKEVYKRMTPPITDTNPASAVAVIVRAVLVVASGFHRTPRIVFKRPLVTLGSAVFGSWSIPTARSAATALSMATVQRRSNNVDLISTSAVTAPHRLLVPIGPYALNHGEQSKTLAGQVEHVPTMSRHANILTRFHMVYNVG